MDDRDDLTITCDSENEVLSCSFRHTDPISEYEDGEINSDTIKCTGSKNENGETCQDDTRIKFRITQNSCGIDITDTTALDTGKWVISALTETSNGGHSVSYPSISILFNKFFPENYFVKTIPKLLLRARCVI